MPRTNGRFATNTSLKKVVKAVNTAVTSATSIKVKLLNSKEALRASPGSV